MKAAKPMKPKHGTKARGLCRSCRFDTIEGHEYYMVTDKVWAQSGLPKLGGMLCIGCLEAHIGRPLVRQDFTDCLLNTMPQNKRSARLRAALEREAVQFTLPTGRTWYFPPSDPLTDLQTMVEEMTARVGGS
jgi:hypothetical protein